MVMETVASSEKFARVKYKAGCFAAWANESLDKKKGFVAVEENLPKTRNQLLDVVLVCIM